MPSNAQSAAERRGKPRKTVRAVPLQSPARGGVIEIGPSGMLVDVFDGLSVGSRTVFVIGEPPQTVRLRGVVRWCRLVRTERGPDGEVAATFRAGIEFTG